MATAEELHAEGVAFLERQRARIKSPSQRNPYRSWHSNPPDLIERQLQEDGHRTWGFVIYRTTYNSDADWAEFLRRLRFQMEEVFDDCGGRDILDLFSLTIFDDRERFDGADSHAVRQHFLEWRKDAPASEQQHENVDSPPPKPGRSPRYRFAIQVDAESLCAVVHEAPPPENIDTTKKGWVKLINASWQRGDRPSLQANLGGDRWLSMPLPVLNERAHYPPVEGMTDKYIGWMRVPYQAVMSEQYHEARDANWWVTVYCRPPTVLGWPYDDY